MDNNSFNDNMVEKAYDFAIKAHEGQLDKGGKPYIEHAIYVASNFLDDEKARIVAVLHDVVEDTMYTIEDIAAEGFEESILEALRVITKDENMDYMDYIEQVSSNEIASKVKMIDLKHNMDITRISNPTDHDFRRVEKYKKALVYLEKMYGEDKE